MVALLLTGWLVDLLLRLIGFIRVRVVFINFANFFKVFAFERRASGLFAEAAPRVIFLKISSLGVSALLTRVSL